MKEWEITMRMKKELAKDIKAGWFAKTNELIPKSWCAQKNILWSQSLHQLYFHVNYLFIFMLEEKKQIL